MALLTLSVIALGTESTRAARTAAIIMEADSGRVLYEDDADELRYPASLTKMMTLYLLFEAIDSGRLRFDTKLPVSAYAANQAPTKLGLQEGDTIGVRDVILGLITKSANDAAVVAAEGLGGTEDRFAQIMTERARRLGMASTTFRNASGLPDPGQKTTARDLAMLSRALIRTFPHHYHLFSTTEFAYGGRTHTNHNRLNNWYNGADGIKTGYIRASGFNVATSAIRDNRRLIGVVMGGISPSARDRSMARLLDAAFAASGPLMLEAHAAKRPRAVSASAAPSRNTKRSDKAAKAATVKVLEPTDHWGIQVGAFAQAEAARRAAERATQIAPTQLDGAVIELAPLQRRKKGSVYRARLIGMTRTEAREACRILQKRRMDCMTLAPSEARSATNLASS